TKLAEQKIADIFQVSRTLVRQALNRLSRDKLVTLEPARGARVAEPSVEEARQVFEVRQMLEAAMIRRLAQRITPEQVAERRAHRPAADGRPPAARRTQSSTRPARARSRNGAAPATMTARPERDLPSPSAGPSQAGLDSPGGSLAVPRERGAVSYPRDLRG